MIGEWLIIIGFFLFVVLINLCGIFSVFKLNYKEDFPIIISFVMLMFFTDGIILWILGI